MASAAITFSGFNNVDFNLVLNSLMQAASQPLTSLQQQQSALQSRVSTYGTLTSRLQAVQQAADALDSVSALSALAATSSHPSAVGVSAGSDATAGHYDVVVNELARAQVTVSTSSAPDANTTVVASGGSITIGGITVSLTGDVTLQGLADAINGTEDIGVHAAVVRTSTSTYRLALTSTATGVDHAFTIENGLSGVAFADTDGDGVSGDSAEDNAIAATDASLLVNNIPVTGSSNTFADVVPGVTLTAYVKDPATTVSIDVASDSTAIASALQTFVSAYNDLAKFVADQRTAALNGDPKSIGRDPLLRQASSTLRSTLLGAYGTDGFTRLSQIGVTFTQSGALKLDTAALDAALAEDADSVRELVGGTSGSFAAVKALVATYAQADGLVSTAREHLNNQIKAMGTQIEQMQARLALQRDALQKEFIQADMAMSQLKNQTSSLAAFGSGLGSL